MIPMFVAPVYIFRAMPRSVVSVRSSPHNFNLDLQSVFMFPWKHMSLVCSRIQGAKKNSHSVPNLTSLLLSRQERCKQFQRLKNYITRTVPPPDSSFPLLGICSCQSVETTGGAEQLASKLPCIPVCLLRHTAEAVPDGETYCWVLKSAS